MDAFSHAQWRKSRRSGGHDNCVEVTRVPAAVGIRDSKATEDGALALSPAAWARTAAAIATGTYDL